MAKVRNQRKKAVADAPVQYALARRVVLHFFVFICAGAVLGIINQFFANPFGGLKENLTAFARQSAPLLLAMFCLMPVFIRDTLTLSNKIAGPIHNLRNTIKAHAEGQKNVRPLRFRKGDFWGDLPEQFNAMTERFRQQQDAAAKEEKQELVEA